MRRGHRSLRHRSRFRRRRHLSRPEGSSRSGSFRSWGSASDCWCCPRGSHRSFPAHLRWRCSQRRSFRSRPSRACWHCRYTLRKSHWMESRWCPHVSDRRNSQCLSCRTDRRLRKSGCRPPSKSYSRRPRNRRTCSGRGSRSSRSHSAHFPGCFRRACSFWGTGSLNLRCRPPRNFPRRALHRWR